MDLEKENAELKAQLAAKEAELATERSLRETAEATIKEKDKMIEEKNGQIVGIRRENTTLKKLSEEEKQKMTDAEIASHENLLRIQEELENTKKENESFRKKESESRKNAIIEKYAKGDPAMKAKIELKFSQFKGAEEASTEQEIEGFVVDAYKMVAPTGTPDPVINSIANGGDGDIAPQPKNEGDGFADSSQGKGLASALNLNINN